MKKYCSYAGGYVKKIYSCKIFKLMRLTLFLIFITVFQAYAIDSYSQNTKLSLNLNNVTVASVLEEIQNTSEFFFLFNAKLIDVDRDVSITVKDEKISEILTSLFSGQGVNWVVYDRQIILTTSDVTAISDAMQQQRKINGTVTDKEGSPLPGVNVVVTGTTQGTLTDVTGKYSFEVPQGSKSLTFSFIGMETQEITIGILTQIDITMTDLAFGLDEVIVVGYGTQKKSDITGTVASLSQERLSMVPNTNITQAIQGAMSGISINTNSGGASPDNNSIIIRGRNSIKANNNPLIVVDGFPYEGLLSDINPMDIQSIEILKDASSASIYGSRGANGVILVTTKLGIERKPKISYSGYYSVQKMIDFPVLLDGAEFYNFKMTRNASTMTLTEEEIYNSGKWIDWSDLALRNGQNQQHDISVSGSTENVKYYVSGNILNVKGLAINDQYLHANNRINIESKITDWLTLGTRTNLSYSDKGGIEPNFDDITWMSPLTKAYNNDGTLTILPNAENPNYSNPLQGTLASNIDRSYQVVTNNFLNISFPFIPGLEYRINAGVRIKLTDYASYYGRDTKRGVTNRGDAHINRSIYSNSVIENILNYSKGFEKHKISLTALYSYEGSNFSSNDLVAFGFPHDILGWYATGQAELKVPSFENSKTALISQMIRANYNYDGRYLLTLTGRRDGYSGFGSKNKWGVFPSVALGWNLANENFFPFKDLVNTFKLRTSWGKNGNQAVGAYETISRLISKDFVSGLSTLPGYIPFKLGEDNLGWETTETFNIGLDFGLLSNRIYGDINFFKSKTSDLLLGRTISSVHGITSVTQNIGKTENNGVELSIQSTNIQNDDFKWSTSANFSFIKNKIVSLYGELDQEGNEIDDIGNNWFIGEPILVNYGFEVIGVWQLDEAVESAKYGSQPGFVKLNDLDNDYDIDANDRKIIGQQDPKFFWGLTNILEYKNFMLSLFVHGVHGVTKLNTIKSDDVWTDISRNTTKKNWWTPDNPTNDFYMNKEDAEKMGGGSANYYENASFVRFKDITLAYNLPDKLLGKIGFNKFRIYVTGRNLFTITSWEGLDPELSGQRAIPLQKEYVVGLNIEF